MLKPGFRTRRVLPVKRRGAASRAGAINEIKQSPMKNTTIIRRSRTLSSLRLGTIGLGGMALLALTLSVRAGTYIETNNVDVSRYILYTDPNHPERQILLGGFSGLVPVPDDTSGTMFYTITDRGPTQDFVVGTTTYKVLPCYNLSPMIVKLHIKPCGTVQVVQTTPLKRKGQRGFQPISGRANGVESSPEILCDPSYHQLPFDPDGLDPEGITIDQWGHFWITEEYRPSIAMVAPNGNVLMRLVPKGCLTGTETIPTFDILPAVLVKRVNNRGMEGITFTSNGRLYAIVQRPLANPTSADSDKSCNLRIVEVNLLSLFGCGEGPIVRQLLYCVDMPAGAKVYASDLCAISPTVMLVPERKTDKLYAIDISSATDITLFETESGELIDYPTKTTIEQLSAKELATLDIQPVKKSVVVPKLTALYPELTKCEGVAVANGMIVLTYDNDFNLGDFGEGTSGSIVLKSPEVYPALIRTPLPEEIVFH